MLEGALPQGKDGRRHQVKVSVLLFRGKEEWPDLKAALVEIYRFYLLPMLIFGYFCFSPG